MVPPTKRLPNDTPLLRFRHTRKDLLRRLRRSPMSRPIVRVWACLTHSNISRLPVRCMGRADQARRYHQGRRPLPSILAEGVLPTTVLVTAAATMPPHRWGTSGTSWPSSRKTARVAYRLYLKPCRVHSLSNPGLLPNRALRVSLAGCSQALAAAWVL